jgi:hypothetical protein
MEIAEMKNASTLVWPDFCLSRFTSYLIHRNSCLEYYALGQSPNLLLYGGSSLPCDFCPSTENLVTDFALWAEHVTFPHSKALPQQALLRFPPTRVFRIEVLTYGYPLILQMILYEAYKQVPELCICVQAEIEVKLGDTSLLLGSPQSVYSALIVPVLSAVLPKAWFPE